MQRLYIEREREREREKGKKRVSIWNNPNTLPALRIPLHFKREIALKHLKWYNQKKRYMCGEKVLGENVKAVFFAATN